MNSSKIKTCSPDGWEDLYRHRWHKLPWIGSRVPIDPLKHFFEMLTLPRRVLDFGCGEGRIAEVLDQWRAIVTAVDCSETAIHNARPLRHGCYRQADKLADFADMGFNGLLLWGVLHHYPPQDWRSWIASARNTVAADGILLLGGFDCQDDSFNGRSIRTSPTTGAPAFCMCHDLIESMLEEQELLVLESGVIQLEDGGSSHIRTWRYIFAKR